ncbi:MAG TPA: NBR1-Ig-like domain-containing protein [Anaerolineales bacterium]|nr:NBR1-Ig-like domain-containing protein [Anaerolineales bacterium]
MKKGYLLLLAIAALVLLSGCNLPGASSAGQVQTAAAETVSVNLTQSALLIPSATNTTEPTATPEASATPAESNTPAASATTGSGSGGGCDVMQFVADVSVPDGEEHAPDTEFVKTWRLRNAGTCSWSPSYAVVFVSGNAMGGPASQNLTETIVPGSTIDISITLTAPHELGDYTGYWALRNAASQSFGSFYVQIEVTEDGAGGGPGGTTLSASSVGRVDADGDVGAAAHAGANSGTGVRGFVSFDISAIPNHATIEDVEVDFTGFDTVGNPFASMGCLQAFAGSFFPLDAADYNSAGAGPDMEWCSGSELDTVFSVEAFKERLQDAIGSSTVLEYRLRFSGAPSGDALVRFLAGGLKLIVTYSEP